MLRTMRKSYVSHNAIASTSLRVNDEGRLVLLGFGASTSTYGDHAARQAALAAAGCLDRESDAASRVGASGVAAPADGGGGVGEGKPAMCTDDEAAIVSALADARAVRRPVGELGYDCWGCAERDPMPMFRRRPPETHTLVVWNASHLEVAVAWLKKNKKALRVLDATGVLKLPPKQRVAMCKAMYYNKFTMQKHKYCAPFGDSLGLVVIRDTRPTYNWMGSFASFENMNANMKSAKMKMRNAIARHMGLKDCTMKNGCSHVFVHSSVNPEEALITLTHAGLAHVALDIRPRFESLAALFAELDAYAPFKYVVHHYSDKHAGYMMRGRQLPHAHNFDLLVNDFYMFKAVAGALAVEPLSMREREGGTRVHQRVNIGGNETVFVVRWVGDGYIDSAWASDVLKRRDRRVVAAYHDSEGRHIYKSFCVPRAEDHFYMLLYHNFIHSVSNHSVTQAHVDTHFALLAEAADILPQPTVVELNGRSQRLWRLLEEFLGRHCYTIACPHDTHELRFRRHAFRPSDGSLVEATVPQGAPKRFECIRGQCGAARPAGASERPRSAPRRLSAPKRHSGDGLVCITPSRPPNRYAFHCIDGVREGPPIDLLHRCPNDTYVKPSQYYESGAGTEADALDD